MTLKTIATILNVSLIFALLLALFVQDKRLQSCKLHLTKYQAEISLQDMAISHMKEEGDKLAKQIAGAQKDAQKTRVEYDEKIKSVYNSAVPNDCEGAMKWGVLTANLFQKS